MNRRGSAVRQFAVQVEETRELSRLVAYRGTFAQAVPEGQTAPVTTPGENVFALTLAGQRVATAGYRIADMLAMAVDQGAATRAVCPT